MNLNLLPSFKFTTVMIMDVPLFCVFGLTIGKFYLFFMWKAQRAAILVLHQTLSFWQVGLTNLL